VVIIHVHDDHVGGTVTDDGAAAFPTPATLVRPPQPGVAGGARPAQLREPGLATGPDDDVEVALRACRLLIGELVDSGRVLAPPRFAEPFGRLVSEGPAGVGWLPLA
jgi:hypothetical protein